MLQERLIKTQIKERPDVTPSVILVDGNGIMHTKGAGIACFVGLRTGIPTIGVGKTCFHHDGLTTKMVASGITSRVQRVLNTDFKMKKKSSKKAILIDLDCIDAESEESKRDVTLERDNLTDCHGTDNMIFLAKFCRAFAVRLKGQSRRIWGAALVGHGGKMNTNRHKAGTKKPIFVSVGHSLSLKEAIMVCAKLSNARIPEPIRVADLHGRELMRARSAQNLY